MKQFNLEAALRGEPVCTRDGRTVENFNLITDSNATYPLTAVVTIRDCKKKWIVFTAHGTYYDDGVVSDNDLFMFEKEEETFKPFDHIIGKMRGNGDYWCIDLYSEKLELSCKKAKTSTKHFGIRGTGRSIVYSEVHHYEEWMEKYIGTTTPFNEWKKGGQQ